MQGGAEEKKKTQRLSHFDFIVISVTFDLVNFLLIGSRSNN